MVVMKTGVDNNGELGTEIKGDQLNNNNSTLNYILLVDTQISTVNGIESQGGAGGLFVGDPSGLKNGGVGVWGRGGDAGYDPRIDGPHPLNVPPGPGVKGEVGKAGLTDGANGVEGYGTGSFYGVAGFGASDGSGAGVYGIGSPQNTGVVGQGGTAPADGVRGFGTGSFSGVAGFGDPASNGTGVFGEGRGSGAPGVRGIGSGGPNTDPGGAVGVYGQGGSRRSALGPLEGGYPGVVGQAGPALPAGGTNGVEGYGTGSFAGVAGFGDLNRSGMGVYGYGHLGVMAAADGLPGAIGLLVSGEAFVNGNLLVLGSKSAAVPFADGSHRRLYCMESPECWFEDFGEAKLVKGKAQIKLPRDFAGAIQPDSYHVFLTPYGHSSGLCVSKRTRQGFVVEEQGSGKSSLSFAFRIVGKRKGLKAERFAKVAMPKAPKVPIQPSIGQPPSVALSADDVSRRHV